jgi:hypothetical protein
MSPTATAQTANGNGTGNATPVSVLAEVHQQARQVSIFAPVIFQAAGNSSGGYALDRIRERPANLFRHLVIEPRDLSEILPRCRRRADTPPRI